MLVCWLNPVLPGYKSPRSRWEVTGLIFADLAG
jgi:hypothetical protein